MFLAKLEKALLFLTILFLPTQLGKHFWPDFSHIYSLKIDYLSPALYFWDILIVGLLVVWFLQKPRINKTALSFLLFFLLTQTISLLGASNIGAGLVRLEQYLMAGFFGIYLASIVIPSERSERGNLEDRQIASSAYLKKKIFLPLALGIIGESVIAILQFAKGGTLDLWILGERTFSISTPGIAKFDFHGLEFLRPYGTFPHPNVLAGYLLLTIVILRTQSVIARRESATDVAIHRAGKIASPRSWRGLAMTIIKVSGFLAGSAIFLTMSRTAIAAGFIAILILIRRKWLILMGVLLLVLSPILFTRFYSLLNFDSLTLLRREELIGSAFQIFLKSPIFGVGLNNFISTVSSDLAIGPSRFLQPVHNILLLALSETGLVGLIGLISLIGYPMIKSAKLLPWFIIIFLGMFDHYFLTLPQGYRLLFLVWGLSFSMLK